MLRTGIFSLRWSEEIGEPWHEKADSFFPRLFHLRSCTLCASPGSSSSSGSKGHPGVWTLACVLAGWGVLEVLPFLYSSQFILSGCSPNMGEGRAVRRGRGHTQCPVAWGHRCPRTCRSSSLCHLWRVFQGHPGTPGGRRRGFCLQMLIPAEAGVPDAGAPVCCHM